VYELRGETRVADPRHRSELEVVGAVVVADAVDGLNGFTVREISAQKFLGHNDVLEGTR
jgi:hypothetical protein